MYSTSRLVNLLVVPALNLVWIYDKAQLTLVKLSWFYDKLTYVTWAKSHNPHQITSDKLKET